ncbi:MAG: endonuclease domain-containing protein [Acidimicrobiia bacterium]|nr:endonuclease domain-containing protein [Acidimicrobiia bacterium]
MARPQHFRHTAQLASELRLEMSWSERRLWRVIKKRQLGVRFRRQVPIGPFVADFACLDPKLVIEVDGPSHEGRDETPRTRYMERQGFTVLRFENEDVRDHLDGICESSTATLAEIRP